MKPQYFYIWSIEHGAWWGPDHNGYTHSLAQAGTYPEAEANAILTRANYPPRGIFNECKIPVECLA